MSHLGEILDDLLATLQKYVVFKSAAQRLAVALWIVHTYVVEHFDTTPYLAITSAEKRSGKSQLLALLDALAARPWLTVLPTEAVVFRKVAKSMPTLLLDEVDAIYGPKAKDHEGLRALLNAGFQRGAKVPRCVGPDFSVQDFDVFSPKALAGIGDLPDTIADRSIPIRMKRRARREPVAKLRRRTLAEEAGSLRERLEEWSESAEIPDREPPIPEALSDRAADAWEPLIILAELAGPDFAARAREAAVELHASQGDLEATLGVRLLADIRSVFDSSGRDRLFTDDLLHSLNLIEEAPWGEYARGDGLSSRQLAKLVRPYEVASRSVRSGEVAKKGYLRADFEDAWARYVPEDGFEGSQGHSFPESRDAVTDESLCEQGEAILRQFDAMQVQVFLDGQGRIFTQPPPSALPKELSDLLNSHGEAIREALGLGGLETF